MRQLAALELVLRLCGPHFDLWYERLEFDETKQKVSVEFDSVLDNQQKRCYWSALVAIPVVGWTVTTPDMERQVFEFPVVSVPAICAGSVNAEYIWDALFEQPLLAPTFAVIARLRRLARRVILVRETDAASPGHRCIASELRILQQQKLPCLHILSHCFLHQNNLVVREVTFFDVYFCF